MDIRYIKIAYFRLVGRECGSLMFLDSWLQVTTRAKIFYLETTSYIGMTCLKKKKGNKTARNKTAPMYITTIYTPLPFKNTSPILCCFFVIAQALCDFKTSTMLV